MILTLAYPTKQQSSSDDKVESKFNSTETTQQYSSKSTQTAHHQKHTNQSISDQLESIFLEDQLKNDFLGFGGEHFSSITNTASQHSQGRAGSELRLEHSELARHETVSEWVPEGQRVTLLCQARANPPIRDFVQYPIEWYHNGRRLGSGSSGHVTNSADEGKILSPTTDDFL